ncbi:MAG: efflux RND transporter periplasmic adaptor subunit [Gammaproteobacteria bacterium]|nr:efflux RND transporter periplasmic adaptor subunit [Gammaproteobacteria bacterium]
MNFFLPVFLLALFVTGCSDGKHHLSGYIEGEYTYIASGVSGTLFNLFVQRGQVISKDTLLYKLDPEPEKASTEATQANIADLQAQTAFAKLQYERQHTLYAKQATPKASLDQAQTDFSSKSQQLAATQADYIQSHWALAQKTMSAPVSGQVFDVFFRVGEKVQANTPVLAILAPENIKVLFYVPEALLSQLTLNQEIHFSCDHCKRTAATISYISPEAEYTPPVIYSKDTRDKLVYLVRASIPADTAKHFHPGQPIDIDL